MHIKLHHMHSSQTQEWLIRAAYALHVSILALAKQSTVKAKGKNRSILFPYQICIFISLTLHSVFYNTVLFVASVIQLCHTKLFWEPMFQRQTFWTHRLTKIKNAVRSRKGHFTSLGLSLLICTTATIILKSGIGERFKLVICIRILAQSLAT